MQQQADHKLLASGRGVAESRVSTKNNKRLNLWVVWSVCASVSMFISNPCGEVKIELKWGHYFK